MTDDAKDAGATLHDGETRQTSEGREFGGISYVDDDLEERDDLRRRSSSGAQAKEAVEHWLNRPSRSTGARRRER